MAKSPAEQIGVDLPEPEAPEVIAPEPEGKDTPEASVPERPDWLPDKFKEPEQLVRSYSELESKLGEQGKTISDLQRQLEETAAAQQQQQQPYGYEQPWTTDEYLAQVYEENPVEAMRLTVAQQLQEMQQHAYMAQQQYAQQQAPLVQAQEATQAEVIAEISENRVAQRYDDYPQFSERAKEILTGRNIPLQDLYNLPVFEQHLDEAYKLAKYESLSGQEEELRSAGVSQEEIDRLRKAQAETLTARRSAPREQLSPEEEMAQKLIRARAESGKPPWYS